MENKNSLFRGKNGENYLIPFILITSLFFMWGLANNMTDTLLAAFKKIMSMSDFQTSLIQIAFYGSYFCFALPAAIYIKKKSYKSGVLLGLLLYATGCFLFLPASSTASYGFYLVAIYVLAGGCSILETSANPYILSMGAPETATRRLNMAQAFNPIGSITGILLSQFFILGELNTAGATERAGMAAHQLEEIQAKELSAVTMTYVYVGIVLLALFLIILARKMPKEKTGNDESDRFSATFRRLIKNKRYTFGVLTQFFYIGAQIGVWSYTIRYVMVHLGYNEQDSASVYLVSIIGFTAARFVFTALMKYIKPSLLLVGAALGAIACSFVVIFAGGITGVAALVGVSLCMSLMFPTIYGIAMSGLGEDAKIGGSGLIMAILGGAILTAVQGLVSDATGSINYAYAVPLCCFVIVAIYGIWISKLKENF
ncbi:L-fucose:H+ symporter permease [Dysgonomonas sp. 216]|uniref:L-fucose:H+ symporter permease n=1 Tax=Dysgonomonas sp. 216 TaxID=2302934 RepID=UPI0013D67593|nr:L-fucose:H+ symporter permease [Dysgonomonas sp. 216]NDW19731.1 L-fucose:H+ symporter permease [Dysgonomonas sp. 216]